MNTPSSGPYQSRFVLTHQQLGAISLVLVILTIFIPAHISDAAQMSSIDYGLPFSFIEVDAGAFLGGDEVLEPGTPPAAFEPRLMPFIIGLPYHIYHFPFQFSLGRLILSAATVFVVLELIAASLRWASTIRATDMF